MLSNDLVAWLAEMGKWSDDEGDLSLLSEPEGRINERIRRKTGGVNYIKGVICHQLSVQAWHEGCSEAQGKQQRCSVERHFGEPTHHSPGAFVDQTAQRKMTNRKTVRLNALVGLLPLSNPHFIPGPEMFQIPGIGGVNGNAMAISNQPLGDLLEV